MRPQIRLTPPMVAAMLLGLGACVDERLGPDANKLENAVRITPVEANVEFRGLDADFAKISMQAPEFGGFVWNADGTITAYVTDLAKSEVVRSTVANYVRSQLSGASPQITLREARYAFSDLLIWKSRARSLLGLDGVSFLDADEAQNRVVIAVHHDGARQRVLDALAALGIPVGAVSIEHSQLPVPAATVRQSIRPTVGGIQITNALDGEICTLGFNVLRNGVRGFVTASHCTTVRGGVDGSVYRQPGGSTNHATEVLDPPYFSGGACPASFRCRYSDAALANYVSSVTSTAKIAETPAGSLTISAMTKVDLEAPNPGFGLWVNKTGRTTGQTVGRMNRTCFDTGVAGEPTIKLLCQYTFYGANLAGGGDSGGPVWFKIHDGVTRLYLAGIFWGLTSSEAFFSSIDNVHRDLGAFQTTF